MEVKEHPKAEFCRKSRASQGTVVAQVSETHTHPESQALQMVIKELGRGVSNKEMMQWTNVYHKHRES